MECRAAFMGIDAGEPECASAAGILGVTVGESLNDGQIGLVPGKGCKTKRERIVGACFFHIGEPSLLGNTETDADENHLFWWR